MTYRVGNHQPQNAYRSGGSWQLTIVREGIAPPDAAGKRPDDTLIGVVVNPIPGLTREETTDYICALLTGWPPSASQPADSCTCATTRDGRGVDPACLVHQGRRARGPKPPPVGPGCICDGSGRTCPRHGAVL